MQGPQKLQSAKPSSRLAPTNNPSVHLRTMAEEPQPDHIREGADAAKASAALSSLDRAEDDDAGAENKAADTEALGKAMQNLEVKEAKTEKKEPPKKVKIDAEDVKLLVSWLLFSLEVYKLWQQEVSDILIFSGVQIQELEVSKMKATEMLRSAEGDAVKALTAYITA